MAGLSPQIICCLALTQAELPVLKLRNSKDSRVNSITECFQDLLEP